MLSSKNTKPGVFRTLVNFLSQEDVLGPQINSAKIKALQLYRPLHFQVLRVKTLLSSGDPWSLTNALGLRNWFPIHHTPKDYPKVDPTSCVESSELSVAQVFRVREGLGSPTHYHQDLRNTPYKVRDTSQIPAFDFDTAKALAAAFDLDGAIVPASQTPEEIEIEMKKLTELWEDPWTVGKMTPFSRTEEEKEAEAGKESWATSLAQQEKKEERRHPQLHEDKALDKTIQDIVDAGGTADPKKEEI